MQDRVRPPRRATYADLEAVPPHLVAELIDGCLYTHPRPAPRHSNAVSGLGVVLGRSFHFHGDAPGGWWLLDEPELHLGEDVAVPDLAGWRRERLARLPDTAYFELAPDWICEALSPSTKRLDTGEKRDLYARHGVHHLWHLDPVARLLETFELRDGLWLLLKTYRDDDLVTAPPFDAAPFQLGLLWAD